MTRQWLALLLAGIAALATEFLLFAALGAGWHWPWEQIRILNAQVPGESIVQPALALLTPVIALVTATFAYRKSTISLAESQRADVSAFQHRYIDASKLLADSNPTARISGAIAMGSLARDWVDYRQECVDVMCGYLRMRPPLDSAKTSPSHDNTKDWATGEAEVRATLANELRRVFIDGELATPTRDGIRINLVGARLAPGFHMTNVKFTGDVNCYSAVFCGWADFDGAVFGRLARFRAVVFDSHADFDRAIFEGAAEFEGATFQNGANFEGVVFNGSANFDEATFRADSDRVQRFKKHFELSPATSLPSRPGAFVDVQRKPFRPIPWTIASPPRDGAADAR